MSPRYVRQDDVESSNAAWAALVAVLVVAALLFIGYFAWYAPSRERDTSPDVTVTVPSQPDVNVEVPQSETEPSAPAGTGAGEQPQDTTTEPTQPPADTTERTPSNDSTQSSGNNR
jgi:cytoskeletal protein RodZ